MSMLILSVWGKNEVRTLVQSKAPAMSAFLQQDTSKVNLNNLKSHLKMKHKIFKQ